MKRSLPLPRSTRWFTSAAAGLLTITTADQPTVPRPDAPESLRNAAQPQRFRGGWEGVLGTSLDFVIESARATEAAECAARVLAEIERLRRLLSTYDPASEIRRVMAGVRAESVELAELLALYATWARRTRGLIDVNLGGVIAAWREAAHSGRIPAEAELRSVAARPRAWNVDALGKGFIIERAVAIARRFAPAGLLNLGGDIRAWGETAWRIGIANPARPADNAPPLAQFDLRDAAVATSGGYARIVTIDGARLSHLIDPRTHRPLAAAGSATVVAADSVTANALALAASIGGAERGAALAAEHSAAGYLFADPAGGFTRGGIFTATAAAPAETTTPSAWPAGFQVTMQVALKKHTSPRQIYRPQVAVWIENSEGRIIRAITVWGLERRWRDRLTAWSDQAEHLRRSTVTAVTRATRPAGSYTVTWDGKDEFDRPVAAGRYKLCLEIAREDGRHVLETTAIECGAEPAVGRWRATAESDESAVSYGPAKN